MLSLFLWLAWSNSDPGLPITVICSDKDASILRRIKEIVRHFLLSKLQEGGSFILRDPENWREHFRMCGEVDKELSASKTFFVQVLYWKELTEVKVFSPRRFQGLLNQSNSSFEGSSRAQLQMMTYIESYLWIQFPSSLPGLPHHQQSLHQGGESL